jgi:hypothetical protein
MPASIRVESGISAGTNFWIDRPVLRIGSDPQCEICLPSAALEPQVLTLEFRGGGYRAYNRGSSVVMIGSTTVPPGSASTWDEDSIVHLPGDLRLVLQYEGDPRPCPRPETHDTDGLERKDRSTFVSTHAEANSATANQCRSRSLIQMGIIAACGLATVVFLFVTRREQPNIPHRPTFEAIVAASQEKEEETQMLVRQLQYAQAALVRANSELALENFSKLRDRLLRQKDSLPAADRQTAQQMLDYVQFRLGQLQ